VPGSSYVFALIVNGVQREAKLYAAPLASLAGDKTPWRKIVDYSDGVTDLAIHGDTIYLMSHNGAPHFKVLRMDLAKGDIATAEVVVPESDNVVTGLAGAQDALYVRRMHGRIRNLPRVRYGTGGIRTLVRVDYGTGAKATAIKWPCAGDMDALAADPRLPGALFEAGSWTR